MIKLEIIIIRKYRLLKYYIWAYRFINFEDLMRANSLWNRKKVLILYCRNSLKIKMYLHIRQFIKLILSNENANQL